MKLQVDLIIIYFPNFLGFCQLFRLFLSLFLTPVKIVIGPVFHESLTYLDEMKDLTFLSLTNKTLDLPKNVISAGISRY